MMREIVGIILFLFLFNKKKYDAFKTQDQNLEIKIKIYCILYPKTSVHEIRQLSPPILVIST